MSKQSPPDNPHKRQHTEQHSSRAKRQRVDCRSTHQYSSSFWDGLTRIWLTKDALREFDRRNRSIAQSTSQRVRPTNRPVTRKFLTDTHQREQTAADDFLHNCTSESLKTFKRFARNGGADLCDLRGYPEPTRIQSLRSVLSPAHSNRRSQRPSRGSSSSEGRSAFTTTNTTTTATKSSRPKDANYQQKLIDGHAFPYGYEFPNGSEPPLPNEWDELNRRLAQPRPSLALSTLPEEEYRNFVRQDARALNEDAVKDTVLPAMLKAMGASDGSQKNVLFTKINPLVAGISPAKPDYYYGAQPEQIHQQVREDLSGYIVPSTSTHFPAVPNFFMEAKGPLGTNREALLQACNVGAIGARAIHSLENYRQDTPDYHGKVSSISSTYNGGQLKIYGHSVAQPGSSESQPHYYMHQMGGFSMAGSRDAFLQGATVFKNARDWAAKKRNAAIGHANAIAAVWAEDEEDEEDEEGEDEDEDVASTQPLQSFAYSSAGGEADAEDSATSAEDSFRRPPAKRSSRRSAGSGRRKRSRLQ